MVESPAASQPRPLVLVVEDNPANLRIAQRWMDRLGFDIRTAHDGAAGLEAALSLQPDVVLLDMSLPVMDGWTVAERLRADPRGRSLFVIALTAHALGGDRERCLEAGCDLFFSKPANFRQIGAAIDQHLSSTGTLHSEEGR